MVMACVFFASVAFQGSAIVKCSRTGHLLVAGWQEVECEVAAEGCCSEIEEGNCGGGDAEEVAGPDCGIECCLLVGMYSGNATVVETGLEVPRDAELGILEGGFPRCWCDGSVIALVNGRVDTGPDGRFFRVMYASFLL